MGKNVGGKGYGEAGRLWASLSSKGSSRSPTEEAAYKYGLGAWGTRSQPFSVAAGFRAQTVISQARAREAEKARKEQEARTARDTQETRIKEFNVAVQTRRKTRKAVLPKYHKFDDYSIDELQTAREGIYTKYEARKKQIKSIDDPVERIVAEEQDLPLYEKRADQLDSWIGEYNTLATTKRQKPVEFEVKGRSLKAIKDTRQRLKAKKAKRFKEIEGIESPVEREFVKKQATKEFKFAEEDLGEVEKFQRANLRANQQATYYPMDAPPPRQPVRRPTKVRKAQPKRRAQPKRIRRSNTGGMNINLGGYGISGF